MPGGNDIKYMRRCLDLAVKAEGSTYPNPLVGAVIVNEGRIIGEGYHLRAGGPHAEVNAIALVKDKTLLPSSVMYVNLEPCSHFGKTPPCADLIISEGIKKVVVGTIDSNEKVSGRGIQKLRAAGCEVITGVLEEESRFINRRFFTFHEKKRPYIILKWARSSDGFIDIIRDKSQKTGPHWISGKAERVLVHRWRATEPSILAGGETIRTDNPLLNVRDWSGADPLRLLLTSSGNIEKNSAVFQSAGTNIVFTHNKDSVFENAVTVELDKSGKTAEQVAGYLYDAGIQSVMVEGGAATLNHFIAAGLWDEARVFTGRTEFKDGIKSPVIEGTNKSTTGFSKSSLDVIFRD